MVAAQRPVAALFRPLIAALLHGSKSTRAPAECPRRKLAWFTAPAAAVPFRSAGSKIPTATLVEKPGEAISTDDLFKGKKVVVLAVPGAFTPGCSRSHLPGYVSKIDEYRAKGVDEVVCISVNDPFVSAPAGRSPPALPSCGSQ